MTATMDAINPAKKRKAAPGPPSPPEPPGLPGQTVCDPPLPVNYDTRTALSNLSLADLDRLSTIVWWMPWRRRPSR